LHVSPIGGRKTILNVTAVATELVLKVKLAGGFWEELGLNNMP
jgi:hypothetical protein